MSLNKIISSLSEQETDSGPAPLNDIEKEYAEYIFIHKELKNINDGMGDDKIRGRIRRAIGIARMLYKEIYGR